MLKASKDNIFKHSCRVQRGGEQRLWGSQSTRINLVLTHGCRVQAALVGRIFLIRICSSRRFWKIDKLLHTMGFPDGSDCKNLPSMQETWVLSLGWEDALEKGMATHSSILAWRIPWTEESGGLQFTGLQRVEHNWMTKHTYITSSILLACFYVFLF